MNKGLNVPKNNSYSLPTGGKSWLMLSPLFRPDVQKQLEPQIADNYPKAADDVLKAFCNAWPGARTGLEGLRAVLGSVPGINVFAGRAISIVLAAKSALCK
jgi:hypothetical protein